MLNLAKKLKSQRNMNMFGTQTCGAVTIHTWNFQVIGQSVQMKNRTFGILTIYFRDMHLTYQMEYFRVLMLRNQLGKSKSNRWRIGNFHLPNC